MKPIFIPDPSDSIIKWLTTNVGKIIKIHTQGEIIVGVGWKIFPTFKGPKYDVGKDVLYYEDYELKFNDDKMATFFILIRDTISEN